MNDVSLKSLKVGAGADARDIAVRLREGKDPGLFWLGGFKSDMKGTKAQALDQWARDHGRAMTRFDYSGHGESEGNFTDGTIGRWLEESLAVFDACCRGPQVVIGSSMGGWLALLLARELARRVQTDPGLASLVLIAPAVDFTEGPTWRAFVETGKKFQAKAPKGVTFFDSGSNVFNAMIGQVNPAYYDKNGKVIVASNPKVKAAWDLTMAGIAAGESAGFAAFSNDWNTGYKKGSFATVTCPAWMMGYIQGQAPATKGKWDIALTPGTGGNWGGSYLAVPAQSKNAAQAADLVKFLTSPASEAYVFKQTGNLPSQPALLKSKAVAGFKNPFFNNAPVGQLFATSALRLKPQVVGPQHGAIQTASSNAIQRVEQKKQTPAKSWSQFLKDVKALS